MKTIAIAGVGPGLGLSLAKVFGARGFRAALIARRAEALDGYVRHLDTLGVEAAGFPTDLGDEAQIAATFAAIKQRFGTVDVLEFSPRDPVGLPSISAANCTPDKVLKSFQVRVLGGVACVQQVLPEMLERGDGGIFFTSGSSSMVPMAQMASAGISTAGLRNYAYCLHDELAPKGVYAGIVCIQLQIKPGASPGTVGEPDGLAQHYWDMYEKRDRTEEIITAA